MGQWRHEGQVLHKGWPAFGTKLIRNAQLKKNVPTWLPAVAQEQFDCLFGIAAIEPYLDFSSRLGGVDFPAELIGRESSLFIELDYEVAQLKSREICGAVVDDPTNLQSPFPAVWSATPAADVS